MPSEFTDPEYPWFSCGLDPVSSFLSADAEAAELMGRERRCIVPCGLRDCYHALQEILEQEECPPAPSSAEEDLFESECAYWARTPTRGEPPDYAEDCWDPWVEETW